MRFGWSEILVFSTRRETLGASTFCNKPLPKNMNGDRIPAIFINRDHQKMGISISSMVNKNSDYHFRYTKYTQNKWQRLEISQLREGDGKVRLVRVVSRRSDERYSDLLQRQC